MHAVLYEPTTEQLYQEVKSCFSSTEWRLARCAFVIPVFEIRILAIIRKMVEDGVLEKRVNGHYAYYRLTKGE